MATETCRTIETRITLPPADGFGPDMSMAITVCLPDRIDPGEPQPILFLFPGAGYTRRYFDIRYPGHDGYSQSGFHAANGLISVAVDHLGVGGSSVPARARMMFDRADDLDDGPPTLTIATMARAAAVTARTVMEKVRAGTLDDALPPLAGAVAIGAGQSMGGFVVTVAQAGHECFDGIALLGSSMTLTDLAWKTGHRRPFRSVSPAERLLAIQRGMDVAASSHWHDEPEELVRADMDLADPAPWRSLAIPACASELTAPFVIAADAARVRVPVLLAYGEEDVTIEPLADLAVFRSTCDLSLLLVPGMAHMHNFAATRARLWRRIEQFGRFIEPVA